MQLEVAPALLLSNLNDIILGYFDAINTMFHDKNGNYTVNFLLYQLRKYTGWHPQKSAHVASLWMLHDAAGNCAWSLKYKNDQ